jgi:D-alanyl-lipoteichoic acid acyltransferase DltB (MBOAT superfamily)
MTFNSYAFLLAFLPIVVVGYYLLTRLIQSQTPALVWLLLASLVFYGTFGGGYVLILAGSVVGNFLLGWWMGRLPAAGRARRMVLIGGIAANLVVLATYKYTGFFADNVNAVLGTHLTSLSVIYPVGLSFYTFIQVGFLIDAYVGRVKRLTFVRYALFGTFFPYVTAGPIVRQSEVLEQLDTPVRERTGTSHVVLGLTMFAMGLFKKAVLADSIAPYANTLFAAAPVHAPVGAANAWLGAVAYTVQLYFDFSGYTDMAIGLGYVLGLRLPQNFNSPLKATSMVDFWRRWHMTMTRFFTDYLYTPTAMAMMRRAVRHRFSEPVRVLAVLCLPIVATFVMVGLWHGAGWGFVIWGVIQGAALAANLAWREVQTRLKLPGIPGVAGWALTMLLLVVSLVFFRATSVSDAWYLLQAMAGQGRGPAPTAAQFYGAATVFGSLTVVPAVIWVVILAGVALLFPSNTQQVLGEHDIALPTMFSPQNRPWAQVVWRPSIRWAGAMALLGAFALGFVGGPSPFLYYHF